MDYYKLQQRVFVVGDEDSSEADVSVVTFSSPKKKVLSQVCTRCIKNSNLRKEVGIAIKSKETSSQFESVRNSYVAIMHQPVTVCSTM